MRCPFCESVPDIKDSEPVCCEETDYSLVVKEDSYEWVYDVIEYQCRDCARSFFV